MIFAHLRTTVLNDVWRHLAAGIKTEIFHKRNVLPGRAT